MFDVFDEELAMLEEDLEAADNEFDALEKELANLMYLTDLVNDEIKESLEATIARLEQMFEAVQTQQTDLTFRISAMKV